MSARVNTRVAELQAILAPCCDGGGSRAALDEALSDLAMGTGQMTVQEVQLTRADQASALALCKDFAASAPTGEGPRTRAQFVKLARKHLRAIAANDVFAPVSASQSTISSNETSVALTDLTDLSSIGVDDEPLPDPFYVARSHEAARLIAYTRKLPYSARFELARLVSRGVIGWPDVGPSVVPDLRRSASPNADALTAVDAVLAAAKAKVPLRLAWANRTEVAAELDREHAAFADVAAVRKGFGAALGTFDGSSAWYGGKLQLSAKLRFDRADQSIDVALSPISFGPSCHLTRRCVGRLAQG